MTLDCSNQYNTDDKAQDFKFHSYSCKLPKSLCAMNPINKPHLEMQI